MSGETFGEILTQECKRCRVCLAAVTIDGFEAQVMGENAIETLREIINHQSRG